MQIAIKYVSIKMACILSLLLLDLIALRAQNADPLDYCQSFATNSSFERIESFSFKNISYSNNTECQTYQNFTNTAVEVIAGEEINGSIQLGTCNTGISTSAAVFIDWNGDFDFLDEQEMVLQSAITTITDIISFEVKVPALADMADVFMLRLVTEYNSLNINSCGEYQYGETQDYTVRLKYKPIFTDVLSSVFGTVPVAITKQAADINNDGALDMFIGNRVFLNDNIDNAFSFTDGGEFIADALGIFDDFDNNGFVDYITSNKVSLNKQGLFSTIDLDIGTTDGLPVDAADIDADGDLDLLIGEKVFYHDNFYQFEMVDVAINEFEPQPALVNYDNDSDYDIYSNNAIYSNQLGAFNATHNLIVNIGEVRYEQSYPCDLNNDGATDFISPWFVTSGYGNRQYQLYLQENGLFVNTYKAIDIPAYDVLQYFEIWGFQDLNNDGIQEVIVSERESPFNSYVKILNYIEDEFVVIQQIEINPNQIRLTIGDFDNDGLSDLINLNAGNPQFIKNISLRPTNYKPSVPANLSTIFNANDELVLKWNEATDAQSTNGAVSYNLYIRNGYDTIKTSNSNRNGELKIYKQGNASFSNFYTIQNLPNGEYHWAVQSIDNSFNSSAFSQENSFTVNKEANAGINSITGTNFKAFYGSSANAYYNELTNEFYLLYGKDNHVYLQRLGGKEQQQIGAPIRISETSTQAFDIKMSFSQNKGSIIVFWKNIEDGSDIEVRAKMLNSSSFSTLIPETVIVNHITEGYNYDYDITDSFVGNKLPVVWTRVSGNPSLDKLIEQRELRVNVNSFDLGPITIIEYEELESFSNQIEIDFVPNKNQYLVSLISSAAPIGSGFEIEQAVGFDWGITEFQLYDLNMNKLAFTHSNNYDHSEFANVAYNPINDEFLFSFTEFIAYDYTENGINYPYYFEVTGAILRIEDDAANYQINYSKIPFNLSLSTAQGVQSQGAEFSNTTYNPLRNEYFMSWRNTITQNYNSQRLDASDNVLLYGDELPISNYTGTKSKFVFNKIDNLYLSLWEVNSGNPNNINNLVYTKYSPPKDLPPSPLSMDLYSAYSGDIVEISGANFGKLPFLNKVYFGSIEAEILEGYDSRGLLRVRVPEGLGREAVPIRVFFDDQLGSSEEVFIFEALTLPTVSALSSLSGERGDELIIIGDKFPALAEKLAVKFGEITVKTEDILDVKPTSIRFNIPASSPRGQSAVSVTVQGQTVTATDSYRVIVPPVISEVSPLTGVSCSNITIKGSFFNDDLSAISVHLNDQVVGDADMVATSLNTILLKLPVGLRDSLSISVATDDRADTFNIKYFALSGADIMSQTQAVDFLSTSELATGLEVGITVREVCAVDTVFLHYRVGEAWDSLGVTADNNLIRTRLDADLLGNNNLVKYYFEVIDKVGNTNRTADRSILIQEFSSISGLVGETGDTITIKGKQFSVTKTPFEWDIRLGEIQISGSDVVEQNDSTISFLIPIELARGEHPLSATLRNKPLMGNQTFRKIIPPVITNIEPLLGTSCTEVTISGNNFSDDFSKLTLSFGSTAVGFADIVSLSTSQIRLTVPEGISGKFPISITTDERSNTFTTEFDVQRGIDIQQEQSPAYIELTRGIDKVDVGISLRDDCTLESISFFKKGITTTGNYQESEVSLLNGFYQSTLTEEDFNTDPLGLLYYFEVVDVSGDTLLSSPKKIGKYLKEADSVNTDISPILKFGSELTDYQIIGLPYEFSPNDISFVFKDLPSQGGSSNIKKWRMFRYNNSSSTTEEYGPSTFNTLSPGEGYWLIMKENQSINIVDGQTVDVSEAPFTVTLSPGWNQIGNPYLLDLQWSDVVAANEGMEEVEELILYEDGNFINGSVLKAFSGGFINYNGSSTRQLILPYSPAATPTRHTETAWSITENENDYNKNNNIANPLWRIPISLSSKKGVGYKLLAVGEHEQAKLGVDQLDQHLVPSFILPFSAYFNQATAGMLAQDYKPAKQEGVQEWQLTVTNQEAAPLTLSWSTFNSSSQESLWLYDVASNKLLDMQSIHAYELRTIGIFDLVVYKGDKASVMSAIKPIVAILGAVYPNPFDTSFELSIGLPDEETAASYQVRYQLVDVMGRVVYQQEALLAGGYHEQLIGNSEVAALEQGVYVLQVFVNGASSSENIKLVKR